MHDNNREFDEIIETKNIVKKKTNSKKIKFKSKNKKAKLSRKRFYFKLPSIYWGSENIVNLISLLLSLILFSLFVCAGIFMLQEDEELIVFAIFEFVIGGILTIPGIVSSVIAIFSVYNDLAEQISKKYLYICVFIIVMFPIVAFILYLDIPTEIVLILMGIVAFITNSKGKT